jgi:hypothetical protein
MKMIVMFGTLGTAALTTGSQPAAPLIDRGALCYPRERKYSL